MNRVIWFRSDYRRVAFADLKVGEEFLWGGSHVENSNWGRKRSNRTADWQMPPAPTFQEGKTNTWGFWKQSQAVYVKR